MGGFHSEAVTPLYSDGYMDTHIDCQVLLDSTSASATVHRTQIILTGDGQ